MSSAGKVHISLWHQQTNDMPFPSALLSCLYKNTLGNQEGNPKRKAMCGRKDTVHGAEKDKDKSRFVSRPNTAIINNVFLFFFVHPLVFITHLRDESSHICHVVNNKIVMQKLFFNTWEQLTQQTERILRIWRTNFR